MDIRDDRFWWISYGEDDKSYDSYHPLSDPFFVENLDG